MDACVGLLGTQACPYPRHCGAPALVRASVSLAPWAVMVSAQPFCVSSPLLSDLLQNLFLCELNKTLPSQYLVW